MRCAAHPPQPRVADSLPENTGVGGLVVAHALRAHPFFKRMCSLSRCVPLLPLSAYSCLPLSQHQHCTPPTRLIASHLHAPGSVRFSVLQPPYLPKQHNPGPGPPLAEVHQAAHLRAHPLYSTKNQHKNMGDNPCAKPICLVNLPPATQPRLGSLPGPPLPPPHTHTLSPRLFCTLDIMPHRSAASFTLDVTAHRISCLGCGSSAWPRLPTPLDSTWRPRAAPAAPPF